MWPYLVLFTASCLTARSVIRSKPCIETIDLGFSQYVINHTVYEFPLNSTLFIGHGHHDLGVMPDSLVVRLYDFPFWGFPTKIYRDAYKNQSYLFDDHLVYEIQR